MSKKELIGNIISEFAPIVSFVAISESIDFVTGLRVLVFVTLISLLLSWFIERRIPKFGLLAASTIFLFGSLSILLRDPFYIIIKDTLYYFTFGLVLCIGLLYNRYVFKDLFGDFFAISNIGWKILTLRWIVFFFLLAIANEIARHHMHPETWVKYKLIALVATWVFGFYQFTLLRKERLPEASNWGFRVR